MSTTSPGPSARAPRSARAGRRGARLLAASGVVALLLTGCADFSAEEPTFTVQPSLTAREVEPQQETRVVPSPGATTAPSTSASDQSAPVPSGSASAASDPCAPTDAAVIATCLAAPWGLAPLPDGSAALVGERTTGRILQVAPQQDAQVLFELSPVGIDSAGDGGLLGLALSPSYTEDGLLYAYVTTATDNRIIRIAAGDEPKAIFTGIPKGTEHNGGRIAFAADRSLYVGTGDTGNPALAADPTSLAGKVLRLDEFGKPAADNPTPGSAVYASGFTQVAGVCPLADGTMAALDRHTDADVLLPLAAGGSYATPAAGAVLWTWPRAEGGAADCAITGTTLATTSLDKQQVSALRLNPDRTFSGTPTQVLDNRYGRLLTVVPDSKGLLWATTSNKDGFGTPVPSDDRVIVIPTDGGGADGGPD
jgi:glucose/arabinose dehydrogenase